MRMEQTLQPLHLRQKPLRQAWQFQPAIVAAGAAVLAWVVRAWEVRVGADQGGHGVGAHMVGTGVPGAGVGLGIGPTIGGLLLTIGAQFHIIMDLDLIARCGATPTLAGEPATSAV
jgi:hypothetical protein